MIPQVEINIGVMDKDTKTFILVVAVFVALLGFALAWVAFVHEPRLKAWADRCVEAGGVPIVSRDIPRTCVKGQKIEID